MAFLKKQIVWIVLGLILVVEIVFLVLLLGKQGEARTKKKNLEVKRDERDRLEARKPGDAAVLAVLGQRKRDITRERGEALLVFWDRSQGLSRLFDDPGLAERDFVKPWQEPTRMGVFLDSYQRAYNREAEKLDPSLEKAGTGPPRVLLAARTAFTERIDLGIGDIYLEQKRFWIIKAVADCAAQAGVGSLDISEIKRIEPATTLDKKAQAENARLSDSVSFKITVMCQYLRLGGFLAELLRSPVPIRVDNIDEFRVAEPAEVERTRKEAREAKEGKESKEAKEAKGVPPEGAEAPATKAAAAAKGEYLVRVTLDCKAAEFNVAIRQVRFTGLRFRASDRDKDPRASVKAKVRDWLGKEINRLDAELKDKSGAQKWAKEERERIAEALEKAASEKDKEKAKAIAIVLRDRFTFRQDRAANLEKEKKPDERKQEEDWGILYDFGQQGEAAQRWVGDYPAFEALVAEARKNLLRQIRQAVEADKVEVKDGLSLTLYPDKAPDGKPIFDTRQMFEQSLDPDGTIQIEYGLVLFKAKENPLNVRRATK
jgi:hypothetical protein